MCLVSDIGLLLLTTKRLSRCVLISVRVLCRCWAIARLVVSGLVTFDGRPRVMTMVVVPRVTIWCIILCGRMSALLSALWKSLLCVIIWRWPLRNSVMKILRGSGLTYSPRHLVALCGAANG